MKLIIGKHSRVFQSIAGNVTGVTAISHLEIASVNFDVVSEVYLFSWSNRSLDDNISIIHQLPLNKLIFVSTVAVLSLQNNKRCAQYPKWKKAIEDIVIDGGGRVIRLGVCNLEIVKNYYGYIPVTYPEMLVEYICDSSCNKHQVTTLIKIVKGGLPSWKSWIGRTVNRIFDILPKNILFQSFSRLILRSWGIFNYGYTSEAFKYFNNVVICGYGVFGSAYHDTVSDFGSATVVVSRLKNHRINTNGFRNTIIGYWKTGLAQTWHAVEIVEDPGGVLRKKVPLINRRPSLPRLVLWGNVTDIARGENYFKIRIRDGDEEYFMFANRVALAAGSIENTKILRSYNSEEITFSDHEVGMLGFVDTPDAIAAKLVRKFAFLICPNTVVIGSTKGLKYLLDARPRVKLKHSSQQDSNSFYLDSTQRLIVKLIFGLSFERINEALFNKFGFGIFTNQMSVCVQVLSDKAIVLHSDGILRRRRICETLLKDIMVDISKKLPSFQPDQNPILVDSQHILGGSMMFKSDALVDLVKCGDLVILGSPTRWNLGATHHTGRIRSAIIAGSYNPLETVQLQ
jgi:hypothetical protein